MMYEKHVAPVSWRYLIAGLAADGNFEVPVRRQRADTHVPAIDKSFLQQITFENRSVTKSQEEANYENGFMEQNEHVSLPSNYLN